MASSSGMAVEFPSSSRTAARLRHIHAHLAAAAQEVEEELYSDPDPDRVEYTSHDTDEVVAAIKKDGVALLKGVLSRETAAHLGSLLTGYEALPHEAGMQILKDGRINSSQNAITIMFNRDPAWLACVDPEPVVKAMDAILCPSHGPESCHLITMKGWRNFPGYNGAKGAAPGVHGGGFHCDDDPVPLSHVAPEDFPFIPPNICTALHYLAGAPPELCPTRVIPGSHRAGRRPEAHEREFNGRTPLSAVAEPGDVLIFRCDVWHAVRPSPACSCCSSA